MLFVTVQVMMFLFNSFWRAFMIKMKYGIWKIKGNTEGVIFLNKK